jgi:hypothetical protein
MVYGCGYGMVMVMVMVVVMVGVRVRVRGSLPPLLTIFTSDLGDFIEEQSWAPLGKGNGRRRFCLGKT